MSRQSVETKLGQASPPPGELTAVTSDGIHACGLRVDRRIVCWGNDVFDNVLSNSYGEFMAVSASHYHSPRLAGRLRLRRGWSGDRRSLRG